MQEVKTTFVEMTDKEMQKRLNGTLLMGKGVLATAGDKENPQPVFPFEQGLAPAGWHRRILGNRNKVEVDAFLSSKYMSYVVFTVGSWRFAVPMDGNTGVLRAVVATRSVGFTRSEADTTSKGSRRKYEALVQLSKTKAKELYHAILVFEDMQNGLKGLKLHQELKEKNA